MGEAEVITPPRVAIANETDINKAFIEFARLVDLADESIRTDFAAADALAISRIVKLESDVDLLVRGLKVGGDIGYGGAADTHIVEPMIIGVWYQGTAPGAVMRRYLVSVPLATITNVYANYPGVGAWAFVTCNYLGVIQLRPATGSLAVRPTDAFYQLSSGLVGYNNINQFGYYYADGERIIGAIGKFTATEFVYIHNEAEEYEHGEYRPQIGGDVTLGVQTYTMRRGVYKRTPHIAQVTGDIVITAKGAGIAGNVIVTMPFASAIPGGAPAGIRFPGQVSFASGFTYAGRTWLALSNVAPNINYTLIANGSALGSAAVTVANMAAASELTFACEYDIG